MAFLGAENWNNFLAGTEKLCFFVFLPISFYSTFSFFAVMGLEQKGLFQDFVPRAPLEEGFSRMVYKIDIYMSEKYAKKEGEKIDRKKECPFKHDFFYCSSYFEVVLKENPNQEQEFSSIREINEGLELIGIRFGYLKVGRFLKLDGENYHYVIAPLTDEEIRELGDRAAVSLDIAELKKLLIGIELKTQNL